MQTRRGWLRLLAALPLLGSLGAASRVFLEAKFSWIKQETNRTSMLVRFYTLDPEGGDEYLLWDEKKARLPKRELVAERQVVVHRALNHAEIVAEVNALHDVVNREHRAGISTKDYLYAK